jgi:hypothetical protein
VQQCARALLCCNLAGRKEKGGLETNKQTRAPCARAFLSFFGGRGGSSGGAWFARGVAAHQALLIIISISIHGSSFQLSWLWVWHDGHGTAAWPFISAIRS